MTLHGLPIWGAVINVTFVLFFVSIFVLWLNGGEDILWGVI